MNCYLVTYDLIKPGSDYSDLYKKIKEYSDWAHPLESVWLVKSNNSSTTIRDNLKSALDSNDKIFVAKLSGEAAWYNLSTDVSDWIKKNL